MIMFDKLPSSVLIRNKEIEVNTDYRIFIKFEIGMQGNEKQAALDALSSFYPAFLINKMRYNVDLQKEMADKFIWFYLEGKTEQEINSRKSSKAKPQSAAFNYEIDSGLIYAAFMETYHINLTTEKLHWWEFKELFKGLSSDTEFCKIKGYRLYDGDDKQLLELKEFYKLPPSKHQTQEKERLNDIYEKLK